MKPPVTFEDFISRYYVQMRNLAARIVDSHEVAKDIVQDIIIELWNDKAYLNIASLDNYLYISVKNRSLNYLKSRSREQFRHRSIASPNGHDDVERIFIEEETNLMLKKAIDSLPEKTADIIRLTLSGLSNKEIAFTTGVSINTVKTLKYGGIKKIIHYFSQMS